MWHCVSVDIEILPKQILFCFFRASFPPQADTRETVLSSLCNLPSSPESVPLQKLMWIVPDKINISPCPD